MRAPRRDLRRLDRLGALIAAVVTLLTARHAHAQWTFDAPCADRETLLSRVQTLSAPDASLEPLLQGVAIVVTGEASTWTLRVDLPVRGERAAETRVLHEASCETLTEAAAVVLSLWLSDEATSEATAAKPATAPIANASATTRPVTPADADNASEPHAIGVGVVLGGSGTWGMSPSLALSIDGGFRLDAGLFNAALGVRYFPGASVRAATDRSAEVTQSEAWLTAQWLPLRWNDLRAGASVEVAFARMHAQGFGFDQPQRATAYWLRTGMGAALRWLPSDGPFALWITSGLSLPWGRPRVAFGEDQQLFQTASLVGQAQLGVDFLWM